MRWEDDELGIYRSDVRGLGSREDVGPMQNDEVVALRQELDRVSQLLHQYNDAAFGIAGILTRLVVSAGLISREALADAVENRAGLPDASDHNPLLLAFGRALRMNLPGGRFDVIDGGKSEIDPDNA